MKKVIDGKVYNVDTAEMIGCRSHGAPSDARYAADGTAPDTQRQPRDPARRAPPGDGARPIPRSNRADI